MSPVLEIYLLVINLVRKGFSWFRMKVLKDLSLVWFWMPLHEVIALTFAKYLPWYLGSINGFFNRPLAEDDVPDWCASDQNM